MSKPAAQVLLERYWEEVNNDGKYELVREFCADPITRHDPDGKTTTLSHDEQIARIKFGREEMGCIITRVVTCANETTATSAWNMVMTKKDDVKMCGIEIFTVENGVLTHCWNTPYAEGHWG